MNHLDIKHLRMICAIDATGNMTRAASRLNISQPALSQQLKDIEGKLKADLFFRTRKKLILTPIGKRLLKTAKHVIADIDGAELEIRKIVSGDRGELKVGAQCIFCYKWLPRLLLRFQQKFPNVEIEIGNAANPARELQAKVFDFIIMAAVEADDNLACVPLFKDQMVCIMPQDHPLSSRPWVAVEDFSQYGLISHAEKRLNRFFQLVLEPAGIDPKRYMAVDQPNAIMELVASGFGISVFPMWAVKSSLDDCGLAAKPITRSGLPVTWYVAFLQKHQPPLYHEEFIHILMSMDLEQAGAAPAACDQSVMDGAF
jgi:LysR family transcriptional regulator for metE and metH